MVFYGVYGGDFHRYLRGFFVLILGSKNLCFVIMRTYNFFLKLAWDMLYIRANKTGGGNDEKTSNRLPAGQKRQAGWLL